MAKKTGLAGQFWLHGNDLSGDVGSLSAIAAGRETIEGVQGVNASAVERLLGRGHGRMDFNTWFNDAAGQEHAALKSLPTTDVVAIYAQAASIGAEAACLVAKQASYDWSRGQDKSLQGNVTCESQGSPLEWCKLLTAGKQTDASATNSASRNDSASSAYGIRAYLQVFSIASGTPTVTIEDSPNDSTWATLLSFTAVADGSEPTAERKTATGTVDQYVRIATTGTFTTLVFAVAYQRGTINDDESLA